MMDSNQHNIRAIARALGLGAFGKNELKAYAEVLVDIADSLEHTEQEPVAWLFEYPDGDYEFVKGNNMPLEWKRKAIPLYRHSPTVLRDALHTIANWPDGGNTYGQTNIKQFARQELSKSLEHECPTDQDNKQPNPHDGPLWCDDETPEGVIEQLFNFSLTPHAAIFNLFEDIKCLKEDTGKG